MSLHSQSQSTKKKKNISLFYKSELWHEIIKILLDFDYTINYNRNVLKYDKIVNSFENKKILKEREFHWK